MKRFQVIQSGFSLVELMVALLLGSLITLAAVQLFSVNQRTFITQQNLSRVLDDGQLALRFLGNDVRLAGYSGGPVATLPGVVFGGANGSADGAVFDQLTVQYVGTQDCQGSVAAAPEQIINTYAVNANGELTCVGSLSGATPVALLSGVEAFRVQYGIDTTQDEVVGPFQFVGAANAATELAAGRPIVAIRLGLLLGVESPAQATGEERSWYVLDREVEVDGDNVLRRVFHTTIMLRNMNWEQI